MKFLEQPQLEMLTSFLSNREVGDSILHGRIEAFSCKRAGEDKKLSKMLEQQYTEEVACSPTSAISTSPLGPLSDAGTRRLLIDLISTMNASFPDHDFSSLRPEQFCREHHISLVQNRINLHLAELSEAYNSSFLQELWSAIDDVVRLGECEVYSYVPDMEEDPFSEGNLWTFNYFFFNRNLKRILFFTCIACSKYLAAPSPMHGTGTESDAESADEREDRGGYDEDLIVGDWEEEL